MTVSSTYEEVDMKKLLELLDVALSSKDPRVKEQLKKLLMIVALIEPDVAPSGNPSKGPLSTLHSKMHELEDRVFRMEMQAQSTYSAGIYSTPITLGQYNLSNASPWTLAGTTPNLTLTSRTATTTANEVQEQLDLFSDSIIRHINQTKI